MKIIDEDVKISGGSSVKLSGVECARLDVAYHKHPQFELALIEKGSGTRIAGPNISEFSPKDVALYGANLPHSYLSSRGSKCVKTRVLQFDRPDFGARPAPELARIDAMLSSSAGGMLFSKKLFPEARAALLAMEGAGPFARYLLLLEILNALSFDEGRRPLSPSAPVADERVCRGRDFICANFMEEISIGRAAAAAGMSEGAFRRLFGAAYGMPPKRYLLNLRLAEACRLLAHTRKSVLEIAFECGFSNISNFNRRFREVFKITAGEYRRLKFS